MDYNRFFIRTFGNTLSQIISNITLSIKILQRQPDMEKSEKRKFLELIKRGYAYSIWAEQIFKKTCIDTKVPEDVKINNKLFPLKHTFREIYELLKEMRELVTNIVVQIRIGNGNIFFSDPVINEKLELLEKKINQITEKYTKFDPIFDKSKISRYIEMETETRDKLITKYLHDELPDNLKKSL